MPMTVEIDEEEIATRIAGAELRLGEILWHLGAAHIADDEVADIAEETARHAVRIDETSDGDAPVTRRLAALLRATADRIDGGQNGPRPIETVPSAGRVLIHFCWGWEIKSADLNGEPVPVSWWKASSADAWAPLPAPPAGKEA